MFKALTVTFKGAFLWESPRSLGPWCIKGTEETLLRVDSSVPLKGHSQLAHMRIRYHFIANLHITETRSILFFNQI